MNAIRLAFLVMLLPLQLFGGEQRVSVAISWPGTLPASDLTLHVRAVNADVAERRFAFACCQTEISLPSGQWFFSVTKEGYWSETKLVPVPDQSVDVSLPVYHSTKVRARIAPGATANDPVTVYFNPMEPNVENLPSSSSTCPVLEGRIECGLPFGVYDLAFRRSGYASLYKWGIDLAKAPVDVGSLVFKKGSTLSGKIELANDRGRRGEMRRATVVVLPAGATDQNDSLRNRITSAKLTTRPNDRGFFSFQLGPGQYTLSASSGDLVSEQREVTVEEGHESVLRSSLRLEQRKSLVLRVVPATDPWNKPWRASLHRLDSQEPTATRRVAMDGMCAFGQRSPGTYEVTIGRGEDDVWGRMEVVLDSDLTTNVTVPLTKVRGSVSLGREPLAAAQLTFRSKQGFSVPARSQADGTFYIWLPTLPNNTWDWIDVEATNPTVNSTFPDQVLSVNQDGNATLELRLPSNVVTGRVVDEQGELVAPVLVSIASGDNVRQLESPAGTFETHGLTAGQYVITAASREGETQAPHLMSVEADEDFSREVELVIGSVSRLRGVVRSRHGPVIGAAVFARPAAQHSSVIGLMPVGPEGEFDLRFPPHTKEVTLSVTAPGFAFRFMRMAIPGDSKSADVAVDQNGGRLIVDTSSGDHGTRAPYLVHNGAVLPVKVAAYLSQGRFLSKPEEELRVEMNPVEEGFYSLCWFTDFELALGAESGSPSHEHCASGLLARYGTLTLQSQVQAH